MTPVQRMERRKARELMRRVLAAAPGATGIVLGPSCRTTFAAMRHVADVAADEGRVRALSLSGMRMVELDGRREIRAVSEALWLKDEVTGSRSHGCPFVGGAKGWSRAERDAGRSP